MPLMHQPTRIKVQMDGNELEIERERERERERRKDNMSFNGNTLQ